ncbi:hypothetical protein Purlil1_13648 [Purpureocillium lilacinum]|uniref:Uncharacterized protein n=1 Tax=Purpureocillium lilacinum TaxID=33203 RepID=A0ABR0BDI0_PURLI|nr:hypothetical protein Purlil1_13648 [Purpureocillium lilacinum]
MVKCHVPKGQRLPDLNRAFQNALESDRDAQPTSPIYVEDGAALALLDMRDGSSTTDDNSSLGSVPRATAVSDTIIAEAQNDDADWDMLDGPNTPTMQLDSEIGATTATYLPDVPSEPNFTGDVTTAPPEQPQTQDRIIPTPAPYNASVCTPSQFLDGMLATDPFAFSTVGQAEFNMEVHSHVHMAKGRPWQLSERVRLTLICGF